MCQMSVGHMLIQSGVPPAEFWHDAPTFVEVLLAMRGLYGFDGVLVSLHGHRPDWRHLVRDHGQGPDGERVRWRGGGTTLFPPDDLPVFVPDGPPARPEFRRFDPASLPDRVGYIPVSQGLRFDLDPEHLFDAVDMIVGRAGLERSVHGELTSPLDYFLDLFGFEQAMVGCLEDPARAKAVLGRFTDGIVRAGGDRRRRGQDLIALRRGGFPVEGVLQGVRPAFRGPYRRRPRRPRRPVLYPHLRRHP
jgi:hypothetical protein